MFRALLYWYGKRTSAMKILLLLAADTPPTGLGRKKIEPIPYTQP
jgi:hypothetical protein